jgi:L-threonylcarbamoyladenylate synthase
MMHHWAIAGSPSEAEIASIASLLSSGGVVVLPTDTIYGLHAKADDADATERIAAIKGRDAAKPFIVLGSSVEQLEQAGAFFSVAVRAILAELWPGPLTAILPLRRSLAAARGAATVAVRVPDLSWLRTLVDATGPLASTSVNRSTEAPIENPAELPPDLQKLIDGVADAGRLSGKPSALVDFTGDLPRVVRDGERLFTQKVWKTLRKSL